MSGPPRTPGSTRWKLEHRAQLAQARLKAADTDITLISMRPLALKRICEALERGYGAGIRDSEILSAAWQLLAYTDGRPPMALPSGAEGVDLYALIHTVLRAPGQAPLAAPGTIEGQATVLPDDPAPEPELDSSVTGQ